MMRLPREKRPTGDAKRFLADLKRFERPPSKIAGLADALDRTRERIAPAETTSGSGCAIAAIVEFA